MAICIDKSRYCLSQLSEFMVVHLKYTENEAIKLQDIYYFIGQYFVATLFHCVVAMKFTFSDFKHWTFRHILNSMNLV